MGIVTLHRVRAARSKRRAGAPLWYLVDLPLLLAVAAFLTILFYAAWSAHS